MSAILVAVAVFSFYHESHSDEAAIDPLLIYFFIVPTLSKACDFGCSVKKHCVMLSEILLQSRFFGIDRSTKTIV